PARRTTWPGLPHRREPSRLTLLKAPPELYTDMIHHHAHALPSWPLGVPEWESPQVALSSDGDNVSYVFVWNRAADATEPIQLSLPHFRGDAVDVSVAYPTALADWRMTWERTSGTLKIDLEGVGEAARVIRIARR